MKVLILIFLAKIAAIFCACDKSELKDLTGFGSYFIYGMENIPTIDGIQVESFDLKTFLRFLKFENTSKTLPLIINVKGGFLTYLSSTKCEESIAPLMMTELFTTSPNTTINGILYGCDLYYNRLIRIIVFDKTRWTRNEFQNHCKNFKSLHFNYQSKMNTCLQDFKAYSNECLTLKVVDNHEVLNVIFGSILVLITIVCVAFIFYRYHK